MLYEFAPDEYVDEFYSYSRVKDIIFLFTLYRYEIHFYFVANETVPSLYMIQVEEIICNIIPI